MSDLYSKFTKRAKQTLQLAHEEARSFNHPYISTEHILLGLIRESEGIAARVLDDLGVTLARARSAVEYIIGIGEGSPVTDQELTARAQRVIKYAIEEASRLNHHYIGTEHLLLGLVHDVEGVAIGVLNMMDVSQQQVRNQVMRVLRLGTAGTSEQRGTSVQRQSKTPYLDALGTDLTEMAMDGHFDLVVERDQEIQLLCRILGQKLRRNAIIVGEAGVGKTSIIQGLARKIAYGFVPDSIKSKRLVRIDISSLLTGIKHREQIAERMHKFLQEALSTNSIVVIENIHNLFGASNDEEILDTGKALERAIVSDGVHFIGETYPLEYRNYLASRSFIDRLIYLMPVKPPTREESIAILRRLKTTYEDHHQLQISDQAIYMAVEFIEKNIPEKSILAEALRLIDEAASYVRVGRSAIPPQLRDALRGLEVLRKEREAAIEDQQFELASAMREREERMQARIVQIESEMGEFTIERPYVTEKDILDVASERAMPDNTDTTISFLSPQQAKRLQQALLLAFPTNGALEQLAFFGLGQNLNVIASSSNLAQRTWELIRWTESQHQTSLLITAARQENPGNEVLRRVCEDLLPTENESTEPEPGKFEQGE